MENVLNTLKKHKELILFFSLLVILTVIICIPIYNAGSNMALSRSARAILESDVSSKKEEYAVLEEQKNQLDDEISDLNAQSKANSEINVKIKSNEEELASLNSQLEEAKKTNEELTAQLEEKQALNNQVNSVSSTVSGKETKLTAGTYSCPADIEAGTYTVSAKEGNIIVYSTSNTVRISKNLASVDGNSYTFTIKDSEKIKFDKDVTIKGEGKVTSKNSAKASAAPKSN